MSGNYLGELPCQLSKLPLDYLEAIDCNIQHVCPHLRKYHRHNISKVFENNLLNNDDIKIMDLRENPDLKHLSFVPEKIYDPPSVAEKFVIDKSFEKANFAFVTNHEVHDKTKFQYRGKIPVYDFTKKPLTFQEKEQICHCCSQCGIQCNDENAVIQTLMVMDFYLVKVGSELTKIPEKSVRILELPMKPDEEIKTYKISSTWVRAKKNEKSIFDYELTKLLPEKWKTKVRTIMCDNCIEKREKKNSDYYSKNKNISGHKSVPEPSADSADGIIDYNRNLIKTVTKESKPQPNQEASTSLHQQTPSELNTIVSVPDALYLDNPNDYIYNPNSLNPSEGSVNGNIYCNRNQNRAITEKSMPQPDQEASTSLCPPPTYNSVLNNSNHQPINTVLGNTIISPQDALYLNNSNDYLYDPNYPHQNTNIQIPQQSYPNYINAYSNG
uniref:Uncharacterized protein n=1 Tax=Panagrolaimus superbus TaxID=310955 RepID=A0A914YQ61_9BILA